MKVLRPEQCVALDGHPCGACIEDVELEKEINELEIRIGNIHFRRRALRTVMNENHDRLIYSFPQKSPLISSFNMPRPLHYSTEITGVRRFISVRCVGNGGNWHGQHQIFGRHFALDVVGNIRGIYPNLLTNGWNALLVFP